MGCGCDDIQLVDFILDNAKLSAMSSKPDLNMLRENADAAARLLKALSNPSRLLILCQLTQGELSVGTLNEKIDLSQSAFSQHLALLRQDGLVTTRKEAQTVYYSLANDRVEKVIEVLYQLYCNSSKETKE